MAILRSFMTLLLFQLLGELLRVLYHLPLPGPVLGLALLAIWLSWSTTALTPALERTSGVLLSILGLLFIPAGVGVIANLPALRAAMMPLVASLFISTVLSLMVTGGVMHVLLKRNPPGRMAK